SLAQHAIAASFPQTERGRSVAFHEQSTRRAVRTDDDARSLVMFLCGRCPGTRLDTTYDQKASEVREPDRLRCTERLLGLLHASAMRPYSAGISTDPVPGHRSRRGSSSCSGCRVVPGCAICCTHRTIEAHGTRDAAG